jgi:hypothetical protein
MKGVLVIIAVLVFASTGMAGEYFKWVDERGVVHFTNVPSSVPEEYKGEAERRVMPAEKEAPSEGTRESAGKAEEPTEARKDRFGRGRDFWVNWTNEARNRLVRAENDYNRLMAEYKQSREDLDKAGSTAQRDRLRNKSDSLRVQMERQREEIRKAREELEIKIPQAASMAGAPAEWVQ